MRKKIARTISYSIIVLLLFGCKSESPAPIPGSQEVKNIIIGGSESVLPIIKLLSEGFEAESPGKRIDFGAPGHTSAGIKGVHNGIFTLGALSRELKPQEKELGLKEFWFAKDALVFATHPSVKLMGLSSNDIKSIYYGEIVNWKELGGPDHKIVVLDRPIDSSPKVLLYKKSFLKKERKITNKAVILEKPQEMDAAIISTPYSIGYASLASIKRNNFDLNVLHLDGVQPSPEKVKVGTYPLARPQGLVVKGEPIDLSREFIDFIFSEKGQHILSKNGYVPMEKKP